MTDTHRRGNASEFSTNAIAPDRKPPRITQSRFKEMFGDEPTAKPVRMLRPAESLDKNGSAVNAPSPSITKSNAPSAASTYTEYEKPMQLVSQKSSGNDKSKVSLASNLLEKKRLLEKKAEGVRRDRNSAGANLKNQEAGGLAVVHHDDVVAKITGVEKEEEQYEGDDKLSSGELSSGKEKSG